jgi:hypothetical protein
MSEFDPAKCRDALAPLIATALKKYAPQLRGRSIRALAIDCHPWHRVLELCLCTELDDEKIAQWGKWCLAYWKYFQFTRTPKGNNWPESVPICDAMYEYCEGGPPGQEKDPPGLDEYETRTWLMIKVCAQALLSDVVSDVLKDFKLAKDFELFVSHPDDGWDRNLCRSERNSPSF